MTVSDATSDAISASGLLECDIVMAGGVTSGIIYPGAVEVIARRYRFRSIGGTSAGAIAAAVTAAAEYGRLTGKNPDAFRQVGALPESLGHAATDGHSRLFHLFTPETPTRPLLALLTPLLAGGGALRQIVRIARASAAFWQISLPVVAVLAAGLAVLIPLLLQAAYFPVVVVLALTLATACVAWCLGTAYMLVRHWLPALKDNGYGICSGKATPQCTTSAPDQPDFQGLTDWMHAEIQRAAGRTVEDLPLTFGELWGAPTSPDEAPAAATPVAPRTIELSMIASDISRNRTIQLPFLETPSPLYVSKSMLEAYFPKSVVDWMVAKRGDHDARIRPDADVVRLPWPQNLPILFGARLSLSFPVLLSAVPLKTPDFAKRKQSDGSIDLRSVWLSDGGLTSNFPIHFFDSPIPSRPTFCLNLIDFDTALAETVDAQNSLNKAITEPRAASRKATSRPAIVPQGDPAPNDPVWDFISMAEGNRIPPLPFTAFDVPGAGLLSFFLTLLNTARAWSDNQMLIAPGVRDRVVNIALRDDEGGLNLDMPPNVIADLDRRGRAAGLLISARFDPTRAHDPETGAKNRTIFTNHRWVRFRSFMAAFEDIARRFALSRKASDKAACQRGESVLNEMIANSGGLKLGYPLPPRAEPFVRQTTDDLEELALKMAAATRADPAATFDRPRVFEDDKMVTPQGAAPRPKMRLRLRPLADNDPRAEHADLPGTAAAPSTPHRPS